MTYMTDTEAPIGGSEVSPTEPFTAPVVDDAFRTLIDWVESQPDELTRTRAAHWLQQQVDVFYRETLAELRASHIRELYAEGWSEGEIGNELGISRARINQITRR